jgi:predicted SAM-dependent methyltransferase
MTRRLNWGCGSHTAPGWINSDVKGEAGVDLVCDIREELPLEDDSIEYAVSIHALPELPYPDLVPVLRELWRVLEPGGVLRLGLPDLNRGMRAYLSGEDDYFKVDPDEVGSRGGRFIVHMLWYGYSRSLFTYDLVEELLGKAGFVDVVECSFGVTKSPFPEIVELDNREEESLFVETRKPPGGEVKTGMRRRSTVAWTPYNAAVATGERIRVLDVSMAEGGTDELRACNLDSPTAGSRTETNSLRIVGWAVGRRAAVESVEVLASGEVVARAPLEIERPGIAEAYEDVPGADRAGFRLTVQGSGEGTHELTVMGVLADGAKVPLGAIGLEIGRRGFFASRFGRRRNR